MRRTWLSVPRRAGPECVVSEQTRSSRPAPASKRLEFVGQCRLACCRRWPTYRREGPAAQQHT
eukprot:1724733-Prymnesium_polylepis.1